MRRLGYPRDVVVYERGNVELKHARVFGDDMGGGAVQFVLFQLLIGFDDVCQFVSEIVLLKREKGRSRDRGVGGNRKVLSINLPSKHSG